MSKKIIISKNKRPEEKPERQNAILQAGLSQEDTADHYKPNAKLRAGNYIPINPKGEHLTPEKFRAFNGCNHYSDEEALAVIESLDTLARIVLRTVPKPGTPIDIQQVVHLDTNIQTNKKAA